MGLRKFIRNRKAVKADRSTEMGIAGHEAATNAINSHSGTARDRDAVNPTRAVTPNSGVRAIKLDGSFESNARKRQMIDNLAAQYAEEGPLF